MKKFYVVLSLLLLALTGCKDSNLGEREFADALPSKTLTFRAALPDDAAMRVSFSEQEGSLNLNVRFKADDNIKIMALQDNKIYQLKASIKEIISDGKACVFEATLPEEVNAQKEMLLMGFTGIRENSIKIYSGKYYAFNAGEISSVTPEKFMPPMVFRIEKFVPGKSPALVDVEMKHIGAYEVLHFTNKTAEPLVVNATLGDASSADAAKTWAYWNGYLYQGKTVCHPKYDMISGEVVLYTKKHAEDEPNLPTAQPGQTVTLFSWYIPIENAVLPDITLRFFDPKTKAVIRSNTVIVPKGIMMEAGRAYHAWGSWDGKELKLTDSKGKDKELASITITTNRNAGDDFSFMSLVEEYNRSAAYIDLNNNGTKDAGEELKNFKGSNTVKLQSNTLTLRGRFSTLDVSGQGVTGMEVSPACQLSELNISGNQMSAEALDRLYDQLPNVEARNGSKTISINKNPGINECVLRKATIKGWKFDIRRVLNNLNHITLQMSTAAKAPRTFYFNVEAADDKGVWADLNGDGYMEDYEKVTKFGLDDKSTVKFTTDMIMVEIYGNVSKIDLSDNGNIFYMDCHNSPYLKYLDVSKNRMGALDVFELPNLEYLACSDNGFYDKYPLNIAKNTTLKVLDCANASVKSLDLKLLTNLTYLNVANNSLKTLNVSVAKNLKTLIAGNNSLQAIDLTANQKLTYIDLSQNLLSLADMKTLLNVLPNLTGASRGAIWLALNPNVGELDLTPAKQKNWDVDIKNVRGDNGAGRKDLIGEDW